MDVELYSVRVRKAGDSAAAAAAADLEAQHRRKRLLCKAAVVVLQHLSLRAVWQEILLRLHLARHCPVLRRTRDSKGHSKYADNGTMTTN